MKAKLIWVKKYEWDEEEKVLLEAKDWGVLFTEPWYQKELYELFVLIPLETDE